MRVPVVAALVEGTSIRATCRMTGVAKKTVVKLLTELGEARQRRSPRDGRWRLDTSCIMAAWKS